MKPLSVLALMCAVAVPGVAGPDVLPVNGVAGVLRYDLAIGQTTPVVGGDRFGQSIWASTQRPDYFWGGQGCMEIAHDWGDVAVPALIGGFGFAYATNADDGFGATIAFYGDDNGWNSVNRVPLGCFEFTGLAGTITPWNRQLFWGWIYEVDVPPFVMDANDLDDDGLGDFAYTYWWDGVNYINHHPHPPDPPNTWIAGPLIAGDPNSDECPGIETVADIYNNPDYSCDYQKLHYVGTYIWDPPPFMQFYMELFAPSCPNPGAHGAFCTGDIDGSGDCLVNLADLARLLANYGVTTEATHADGDIDPLGGDGDVDIADLAEMLAQYGDDCN